MLSGLLRHRPLRIHRQVIDRNGCETWRQLCQLYEPRTKSRSISLLQALMSFPNFDKTRTLLEQIQSLERIREEYQRTSGAGLSDDIMTSTLLRVLPKHIQQHLHLQMTSTSDYAAVRQMVLSYEVASSTYSTGRIHAELGVVTSYATTSGRGPQPMEIDQIAQYDKGKGKWKGKGKEGKGKHGKGKDGKGKHSKGKNQSGGKYGKGKGKDKGSNDGKGKNLDNNQCSYCLKFGHWRRDCHKLKDDQKHNRVRQIEEVTNDGGQGSKAASTSGTAPSNVRLVSFAPVIEEHVLQEDDSCEDLTLHYTDSSQFANSYVRVLSMDLLKPKLPDSCSRGALDAFDLTYSDDNADWTLCNSPSWSISSNDDDLPQVRAMVDATAPVEIILDSGADVSALPRTYGNVGVEVGQHESQFIDAQGSPLHVHSTRVARVTFGDVVLKERFIVTDVSIPILALGHLVRAGWSLQSNGREQHLVKGSKSFKVGFKRSSLCAIGCINMISSSVTDEVDVKRSAGASGVHSTDDAAVQGALLVDVESLADVSTHVGPVAVDTSNDALNDERGLTSKLAINAITLQPVLEYLKPGWNQISPDLYAITTTVPEYVDTTMCPSAYLMWLRTTLVKFTDGWHMFEYCKPLYDLQTYTEKMRVGNGFQGVLTLAHTYAIPPEQLGFNVDAGTLPALAQPVERSADEIQAEAVEVEVPVDDETGEAHPDDRAVEAPVDFDSVVVDGVQLSLSSSLANIRIGCESLGLSKRGGKEKCLKRMLEHIKAQELIASTSATVKLQREHSRPAIEQSKPEVPTQSMIDEHSLTHYPYRPWCETCVMHKARQDAHVVQEHDKKQHSVISFDFGFASRAEGDKLTVLYLHDQHTKLMGAIPTPQKRGRCFNYIVTEVVRFIMQTNHREIGLRCDCEPSTLAILEAVKKTCRNLGIITHSEPTPVGDHQANGGAEVTVKIIRAQANALVSAIEKECCEGRVIFGCNHPVYAWAVLHACWIHNRFSITNGSTPFELCSGRMYTGKLAQYGERVLGFLKMELKGKPQWRAGVWIGKTTQNDTHILAVADGIFVTRSIRRLPNGFDVKQFSDFTTCPWDCNYAALGHTMMHAKRVLTPVPTPVCGYGECSASTYSDSNSAIYP